jgi:hypothetical protein
MKWQYTTLSIPATGFFVGGNVDLGKLSAHLNKLGEVGWELVSVFDTTMMEGKTRDVIAVLKRPIS